MSKPITRQQAWTNALVKFPDAAFAHADTLLKPDKVDVAVTGHHASVVFERGTRHYMFHGTQNRDRFVNKYRQWGARPCGNPVK